MTYDLRGNITTLKRNGLNSNGWTGNHFVVGTYGWIDNLTYAYNTKNQLLSVNEASLPTRGFKTNPNATGDQYGYDGNGNLIYDKNKYITSIEYNYLNLPIKVVINNPTDAVNSGSIEFLYDATGTKLRKTVKNKDGSLKETWDYVNGVEYKNRQLQRVAHSEGAVVQNEHGQYQHEYVLRDHLGNTRVTFTDGVNKGEPYWDWSNYTYMQPDNTGYDDGIVTKDDIVHIHHNYSFGASMEGNWNVTSTNQNKYLYNDKQWNDDLGIGWYDYGRRFYDPLVSRFWTKDRFLDTFPDLSPYQYAGNNPIRNIDFMGDSIIVLNAPSGANGMGHAAVLIGNDNDGWKLYSKNGTTSSSGTQGPSDVNPQKGGENATFCTLKDFQESGDHNKYTEGYMINTDSKTDLKMADAATAQVDKNYNVLTASCIDVATDALKAGGLNGGERTVETAVDNVPLTIQTTTPVPNARYIDIKNNNPGGKTIPLKMK